MKILIAASGTGGHLFPAVHIAKALLLLDPKAEISFLGSGRPLEAAIFSKAGSFPLHSISVVGVKNRGIGGLFDFLLKLPRAVLQTWRLLSREKPECIVGVGGYVTVLPVILGRLRGIPSWIHEAELSPGLANYILSFFANKISTAFQEAVMPTSSNVIFTGHPVREGLEACVSTQERTAPPSNILILGGSQGAAALDQEIPKLGAFIKEQGLSVRHQCRKDAVESVKKSYESTGVSANVLGFIDDMHEAYRWADIIISRSGAGSVMELGIVNKPCILVPFPFAQGNHQLANAKTLSERGKGIVCEEGPGFAGRLQGALQQLLSLPEYNKMSQAPNPNRNTDAALRIAKGIMDLAK